MSRPLSINLQGISCVYLLLNLFIFNSCESDSSLIIRDINYNSNPLNIFTKAYSFDLSREKDIALLAPVNTYNKTELDTTTMEPITESVYALIYLGFFVWFIILYFLIHKKLKSARL